MENFQEICSFLCLSIFFLQDNNNLTNKITRPECSLINTCFTHPARSMLFVFKNNLYFLYEAAQLFDKLYLGLVQFCLSVSFNHRRIAKGCNSNCNLIVGRLPTLANTSLVCCQIMQGQNNPFYQNNPTYLLVIMAVYKCSILQRHADNH